MTKAAHAAPAARPAPPAVAAPPAPPVAAASPVAKPPVDPTPLSDADIAAENDQFLAQLAAEPVAMSHPDGGTSDAYPTNKAGHILVPAEEAAAMFSLGFEVVTADDA